MENGDTRQFFLTIQAVVVGVAGVPELGVGLLGAESVGLVADGAVWTLVQPFVPILAHTLPQFANAVPYQEGKKTLFKITQEINVRKSLFAKEKEPRTHFHLFPRP